MTDTAPTVDVIGGLEELTLITPKGDTHTPDGFKYHGIILTSA